MGILDQIAQPQMADIAGALDIRQKRLDADEAKRKEIRMGQLIAEATPNLKEGSPLHQMALQDPKNFMLFSKALGVPLNAGDQMQQIADDVKGIYTQAQSDPESAHEYAMNIKAQRNKQGIETPQLDKWLASWDQDKVTALTSVAVLHRSLNPQKKGEAFTLGDTRYDAHGNVIVTNPRAGAGADGDRPYFQPVSTAQGVFSFNARTGEMEKISDKDGSPILKTDADVELARKKAAAEAEGKNTSENLVDAKKDLSRIEANADEAIGLVKELLAHPGRNMATGTTAWVPKIPGTKQAAFINRFDQIKGDAFLQAFQSLKGGGAITEAEGAKATQAVNRMDRASSVEEFDSAANDFVGIIETGRARARKAADGGTKMVEEKPQKDNTQKSLTYNPKTGKFE
jgi:hypothetical protein